MTGVAGRMATPWRARKDGAQSSLARPLSAHAESDPEPNVPSCGGGVQQGRGRLRRSQYGALCRHSGTPLVPVEIGSEHADAHLEGL